MSDQKIMAKAEVNPDELPEAVVKAQEKGIKVMALADPDTGEVFYTRWPGRPQVNIFVNRMQGQSKPAEAGESLALNLAISPDRKTLLDRADNGEPGLLLTLGFGIANEAKILKELDLKKL